MVADGVDKVDRVARRDSVNKLDKLYQRRFGSSVAFRRDMWQALCQRFFQRYIAPDETVLEIGAGYCEFINSIHARQKIALDVNPDTARYAQPEVEVIRSSSTDMSAIPSGSVDVVFASNFFEHLSRDAILETMHEVARVLRPHGRFLILQPNIRYCWRDYWMFFDHITPLDQYSLTEALHMSGFRVAQMIVRFLPYTTHGKLPNALILVNLYLKLPILWRLFGQQTFVVAELAASHTDR